MTTSRAFEPHWASPPGATVLDLLGERGYSMRALAEALDRDTHQVSRLVYGIERLTEDWAQRLSNALGASPGFWLRREQQYREDLARFSENTFDEEGRGWLSEVPVKDMVQLGWIDAGKSKLETLANALAFFGVASVGTWRARYGDVLAAAAYRSSTAFETLPGAVAAWLRQGEILAGEIDCASWSPQSLRNAIMEVKTLTRVSAPSEFLPKLVCTFSKCGVALVVAKAPSGCRASGAVRFIGRDKAMMLLSFRYLADDQFWFTVFHELGHLLLHTSDELFLEGMEGAHSEVEDEANEFAKEALFTQSGLAELQKVPLTKFSIARLARQLGVSPGVLVGQLQEMGRVPYRHFNYLKVRYTWSNAD